MGTLRQDFRVHADTFAQRFLPSTVARWLRDRYPMAMCPPDFDPALQALVARVSPFTMTSAERIGALVAATRYVIEHELPGAFVECGVWRGGSMMVVAHTLLALGVTDRELILYDTFAGMTPPTDVDVETLSGRSATLVLERSTKVEGSGSMWCIAGLDDVRANLGATGYPAERVRYVVGPVQETLPAQAPASIALLRLDTDWHDSTAIEMNALYPRLSPGGVLLLDDYGSWNGVRKAVDDYFAANGPPPLLQRIDEPGRLAIKPSVSRSLAGA